MGTSLATYYAKLLDMPDSEYKVEILEDGPIKKIAVNGKTVSYTHLTLPTILRV